MGRSGSLVVTVLLSFLCSRVRSAVQVKAKGDVVTHGLGYGHHLHPFYFQGKPKKYYDCAIEDEWKPFDSRLSADAIDERKASINKNKNKNKKKYSAVDEKTKLKLKRRSDSKTKLELDHAKLLRDINEMSEDVPKYSLRGRNSPSSVGDVVEDAFVEGYGELRVPLSEQPPRAFSKKGGPKKKTPPGLHLLLRKYNKFAALRSVDARKVRGVPFKRTPVQRRRRARPRPSLLRQFFIFFSKL